MSLDLEAIEDLPPELTGALTFHLPLEVAALELAGASPEVIAARVAQRLAEAYAEGLVDPPLYRWAVEHYRPVADQLLSPDQHERERGFAAIDALGPGLAGAGFHGLIRLGYGLWRRRPGEVARGLAYLRTRRQVLAGGLGSGILVMPGTPEVSGFSGMPGVAGMPGVPERAGVAVFDLMNLAAGVENPAAFLPGAGPVTVQRLASTALGLVRRNPSSFVAVHTVTALHALVELASHRSPPGEPGVLEVTQPIEGLALPAWWWAYAVAVGVAVLLMDPLPPEAVAAPSPRLDTAERLLAASVDSGETHDLKVVLALVRLHRFGVIAMHDVVQVGAIRLAARVGAQG